MIDEEEAKIAREIYIMFERGMSEPSIAKELFERGVMGEVVKPRKGYYYFTGTPNSDE